MPGTTIPHLPPQFFDDDGNVAAGGSLDAYEAGTTTRLATYSDVALSVANANPIVLDSAGRATIFLSAAAYKFVLKDAAGTTLWTRDNITAHAEYDAQFTLVTGTAGENLTTGDCCYLSDGSGSLTAGRWYKADADNNYSSSTAGVTGFAAAAISSGDEGSIQVTGRVTGLSGLTAGTTYYVSATAGGVTATAPTNKRTVGIADSTTSLVMALTESANDVTGPLPAIDGSSLQGVTRWAFAKTSATGNVGAGEDVLETATVAANTLQTDGDFISAIYWGENANNANAKTIRVSLKDTDDDTEILSVTMPTSEATHWRIEVVIMRDGAGAFHSDAFLVGGPASAATTVSVYNTTNGNTITWSDAVDLEITGEATANDDISLAGGVGTTTVQPT